MRSSTASVHSAKNSPDCSNGIDHARQICVDEGGHLDRKKTDVDVLERVFEGVHATEVGRTRDHTSSSQDDSIRGWLGDFVVSAVQVEMPRDVQEGGKPPPRDPHSER
jgi:hypothetical protein